MPDLLAQLRAYGRQLEAGVIPDADGPGRRTDPGHDPNLDPDPHETSRITDDGVNPRHDVQQVVGDGGSTWGEPLEAVHPPGRSRRSAWIPVAAVTAAIALAASLLVTNAPPEGGVMDRRSTAVLGMCLFIAGCTADAQSAGGGASAPSGQSTPPATVASSAGSVPTLVGGMSDIPVEPGTYVLDVFAEPLQVTVPAGWAAFDHLVLHGPEGATLAVVDGAWDVYSDGCDWIEALLPVGPTVADLVAALEAQVPATHTAPQPVSIGGYSGTEIALTAPADLDYATCYGGVYAAMKDDMGRLTYLETPGIPHPFRILDINGERGIIATWSTSELSESTKAQLDAMVTSLTLR